MTAMSMTTARPGTRHPAESAGAAVRLGPLPRCPACAAVLDGGPVAYHCTPCGRGVMAADIDSDYHAPAAASGRGHQDGGPS